MNFPTVQPSYLAQNSWNTFVGEAITYCRRLDIYPSRRICAPSNAMYLHFPGLDYAAYILERRLRADGPNICLNSLAPLHFCPSFLNLARHGQIFPRLAVNKRRPSCLGTFRSLIVLHFLLRLPRILVCLRQDARRDLSVNTAAPGDNNSPSSLPPTPALASRPCPPHPLFRH